MTITRYTCKRAPGAPQIGGKKRRLSSDSISPPSAFSTSSPFSNEGSVSPFSIVMVSNVEQKEEQPFCDKNLKLTCQVISKAETALIDCRKLAQQHFDVVASQILHLKSAAIDATEQVRIANESLEQRTSQIEQLRGELAAAEQRLKEAVVARDRCKVDHTEVLRAKNKCEAMVSFELALVKDGASIFKNGMFERPDDPKHVVALLPLLSELEVEESLLEAFPNAAIQPISARSVFAKMVMEEVEKRVTGHMSSLRSKFESLEEAWKNEERVIEFATEASKSVSEALELTLQRHVSAESEQEAAERAKCNATRQLREAVDAATVLEEPIGSMGKTISEFQQRHLSELVELRKRYAPVFSIHDVDPIAAAAGC